MNIRDFELTAEISDRYHKLRQSGYDRTSAVEVMTTEYHNELTIGTEDDGIMFWVALADVQYLLSELSLEVAVQAQAALEMLDKSNSSVPQEDITLRRRWYSSAPMPERKRVSVTFAVIYGCSSGVDALLWFWLLFGFFRRFFFLLIPLVFQIPT